LFGRNHFEKYTGRKVSARKRTKRGQEKKMWGKKKKRHVPGGIEQKELTLSITYGTDWKEKVDAGRWGNQSPGEQHITDHTKTKLLPVKMRPLCLELTGGGGVPPGGNRPKNTTWGWVEAGTRSGIPKGPGYKRN